MKTVNIGGTDFELYNFTGIVAETGKNMETKVSGGGGGGAVFKGYGGSAPVSIRSKTIIHDQIFLINEQGDEKSFQLQGFNIACRKDNKLTIVWAMTKGSKTGPYVAVHNYNTKESYYNDKAISSFFTGKMVLWIFGVIVATVILWQLIDAVSLVAAIAGIIYVVVKFNKQAKELKNSINFRDFA